jgi:hypothetical protein
MEIYSGTMPSAGQAARYWHAELDRVLHAAATRYAAGCRAGHRGAPGLVAVDRGLQADWAQANMLAGVPPADIAAGRAQRAGDLASPEELAAAFSAGAAVPVPGREDCVRYAGRIWAPAASGWIPLPPLAPVQGAPSPADGAHAGRPHDADGDAGQWAR